MQNIYNSHIRRRYNIASGTQYPSSSSLASRFGRYGPTQILILQISASGTGISVEEIVLRAVSILTKFFVFAAQTGFDTLKYPHIKQSTKL
eukprot:snap_masked-scaffold_5-processed-gene-15.10-mRNA-1 protein AED:1.00 eAED:1.00 QI:0/0/0/0/1/1/2/0/90